MSRRFVNQLGHQEPVSQIFMASQKQLRPNRNGNLYLQVELSDRSGSLAARMWNASENDYRGFDDGDFVHVEGTTQVYQGALQLIASNICKARYEEVDPADFMPLTPAEIARGTDGAVAQQHGLHEHTPLWYYILKEAEQRGGGEKLGPVGATIVAEVFVGLVHGDHRSYLWLKGKDWKPTLPSSTPGDFTMADLLRFVGDISPIDGISTV
jgi:hypothetical protein